MPVQNSLRSLGALTGAVEQFLERDHAVAVVQVQHAEDFVRGADDSGLSRSLWLPSTGRPACREIGVNFHRMEPRCFQLMEPGDFQVMAPVDFHYRFGPQIV